MAWADVYVQKATASPTTAATSHTVTPSAAFTAGNFAVLVVSSASAVTTPSGWTLAHTPPSFDTRPTILYRTVPAGGLSSQSITIATSGRPRIALYEFTSAVSFSAGATWSNGTWNADPGQSGQAASSYSGDVVALGVLTAENNAGSKYGSATWEGPNYTLTSNRFVVDTALPTTVGFEPELFVGRLFATGAATYGTRAYAPEGPGSMYRPQGAIIVMQVASSGTTYAAAGDTVIASTTSGAVTARLVAAGVVAALAVTTGAVTAVLAISGATPVTSAISGTVTARLVAAGSTVAATSGASGDVGIIRAALGATAAQSATSGSVTALLPTAGTTPIASATAGAADVAGSVSGTGLIVSSTSGTVTLRAAASGATPAASSSSGTVALLATAGGTVVAGSATTGDVRARFAVTGSVQAISGSSGSAEVAGSASGAVAIVSGTSGSVTARRATSGGTTAASATSGAVTARLATSGTTAVVSGTAGSANPAEPSSALRDITIHVGAATRTRITAGPATRRTIHPGRTL